jgi:hypothetical protein
MHNFDFWGVAASCVEVVSAYIAVPIFCVDEAGAGCCLRYTYYTYLKYTVHLHSVHLFDLLVNLEGGEQHIFSNVGRSLQDYMVQHPRKWYS